MEGGDGIVTALFRQDGEEFLEFVGINFARALLEEPVIFILVDNGLALIHRNIGCINKVNFCGIIDDIGCKIA